MSHRELPAALFFMLGMIYGVQFRLYLLDRYTYVC